jgi:signal transduction histidine kinase
VGLALAKWIIDEHKGKIEIESPGRLANANGGPPGTTLIVRLGLADGGATALNG